MRKAMHLTGIPVPCLTTANEGPLYPIEEAILKKLNEIEAWFAHQWQQTPPSITSSVDLRHAGFKLAPVDTNLFPAGFNNLNSDFFPLCIHAVQSALKAFVGQNVLLIPESHTRNAYYLKSLSILKQILIDAGFKVRIGSLDPDLTSAVELAFETQHILIEPLLREGDKILLPHFEPAVIILNNDLSTGIPPILQGLRQAIKPTAELGWANRLKSDHFEAFDDVVGEFSELINIDPWLINPFFNAVEGVDFMAQEGLSQLAEKVNSMLAAIKEKYSAYAVAEKPFVVVKADSGTYGMSVMMVDSADEIYQLNRKQRTRMAVSKGNRKVERVLIQEGVYTFETMPNGAVAEPVLYMIDRFVVGGFYRLHHEKNARENLNAPGMRFEPLEFVQNCNSFPEQVAAKNNSNRFYAYSVIARLAALAAAREINKVEQSQ